MKERYGSLVFVRVLLSGVKGGEPPTLPELKVEFELRTRWSADKGDVSHL